MARNLHTKRKPRRLNDKFTSYQMTEIAKKEKFESANAEIKTETF